MMPIEERIRAIGRLAIGGLVLATGAAEAQRTSRAELGTAFQINYGIVEHIDVTRMDAASSAAQGAALGGTVGLIATAGDDNLRGAAEGAAVGALITGLIARHQRRNAPNAYAYTVALNAGGESKLITDHGDIKVGDCVSIESGPTNNIRRVSDTYCHPAHQDVLEHPDVAASAQNEAGECHQAKQIALDATTEEQMDLALKKVRIFCES